MMHVFLLAILFTVETILKYETFIKKVAISSILIFFGAPKKKSVCHELFARPEILFGQKASPTTLP